jgi:hypothetical protein
VDRRDLGFALVDGERHRLASTRIMRPAGRGGPSSHREVEGLELGAHRGVALVDAEPARHREQHVDAVRTARRVHGRGLPSGVERLELGDVVALLA